MLGVTGADGFVGRALCREATRRGIDMVRFTRLGGEGARALGEIGSARIDPAIFAGVTSLVHCAARVHVMEATDASDLEQFRAVNRDGAVAVARAAAKASVGRFLFLSTAKVLGERTTGRPFHHDDALAPVEPYAVSKAEAEIALRQLAASTGVELVIVRPPLVHGPGAGGNLARLVQLLRRRIPLPLASIRNRRALLGLDNLIDALIFLSRAPRAAGEAVMLRDDPALSTPEIVRGLAAGLGVTPFLVPTPEAVLRSGAAMLGRGEYVRRMLDSLDVSTERTRDVIGWTPAIPAMEGLRRVGGAAL